MRLKHFLTYCLCFLCIGVYYVSKEESTPVFLETGSDFDSEVNIFRLNAQGMLVPIRYGIEESDTATMIRQMMQMMALELPYFEYEAILPEQSELIHIEINEGHAVLDFNQAILDYPKEKEVRMLEAMIWSVTQFEEIHHVSFLIEGEKKTHLTYGTPLQEAMNRRFGINNLTLENAYLHETIPLNLYITKEDSTYIQTFRVEEMADLKATLNQMASLMAQNSDHTEEIVIMDVQIVDNTMLLTMNEEILSEERVVKDDLIKPLLLSIHETFGYDDFQILVNDEIVNFSGAHEKNISASSLQMNQISL